jgi:hypothetical protein
VLKVMPSEAVQLAHSLEIASFKALLEVAIIKFWENEHLSSSTVISYPHGDVPYSYSSSKPSFFNEKR